VTDPSRLSPGEEDLELLRELPLAHPKGGGWVAPFPVVARYQRKGLGRVVNRP